MGVRTWAQAYHEALGVSLLWSNPVLWPEGVETDALVSHVDLVPTLLDFLGIKRTQYKLSGVSYTDVLANPKAKVQDYVLFAFNDLWATFNMQSPPAANVALNMPSYPITNVSNGATAAPANIWVMNTETHTAAIYYDESEFPGELHAAILDSCGSFCFPYRIPYL